MPGLPGDNKVILRAKKVKAVSESFCRDASKVGQEAHEEAEAQKKEDEGKEQDTSDQEDFCLDGSVEYDSDAEVVSDEGEAAEDPHELMEDEGRDVFHPTRDDALLVLQGHKESIFCLAVDPRRRFLVSGGQDHVAIVWDVYSGEQVFIAQGHEDSVTCISFSRDGDYLATGDMAGGIRVWLRPSPTGTTATVASPWRLLLTDQLGDLLWLSWWQQQPRTSAVASTPPPSPAVLLAGDEEGLLAVISVSANLSPDTGSNPMAKYIAGNHSAAVDALSCWQPTPSTPRLLVLYRTGEVRIWDLKSSLSLDTLHLAHRTSSSQVDNDDGLGEAPQEFTCLASPHTQPVVGSEASQLVIVGSSHGVLAPLVVLVRGESSSSGEVNQTTFLLKALPSIDTGDRDSVEAVDFSWTHPFFAFATISGMLGIVDAKTLRVRQKWWYTDNEQAGRTGAESSSPVGLSRLLWSPDSPIFFTASLHGAIIAWSGLSLPSESDSSEPAPLAIWWGHRSMILDLALITAPPAPSQTNDRGSLKLIASASDDATVRLYSVDSDSLLPQHALSQTVS